MAKRVTVDNLDKAIKKILDDYQTLTWKNVDEATERVAKKTRLAVANGSKQFDTRYGKEKYSRGWRVKKVKDLWFNSYIIHQAKKPYETHLLEYGHELDGCFMGQPMSGRARAFPHITPVAEKVPDELQKEVVNAIHRSE